MSEAVEKYAREYADKCLALRVKTLMKNMKLSLEQALNVLEIQGESRNYITKQLQNS